MDWTISTFTENKLFGTTWKSEISKLITIKNDLNYLKNIEIYLPFVAFTSEQSNVLEFNYLDNEDIYTSFLSKNPINKFYMSLFIKDDFNKHNFGLDITTTTEVIPQLCNKKHSYYYVWNNKQLSIKRFLSTYDPNIIEELAKDLLNEYKRFYFMYCKTK